MSDLPVVKDFARLSPPYASVVPSRTPVVQWHATRGGARTSALFHSTRLVPDLPPFHTEIAVSCGIAVLAPNGDLVYVEQFKVGEILR
jgi:hypothetical protein